MPDLYTVCRVRNVINYKQWNNLWIYKSYNYFEDQYPRLQYINLIRYFHKRIFCRRFVPVLVDLGVDETIRAASRSLTLLRRLRLNVRHLLVITVVKLNVQTARQLVAPARSLMSLLDGEIAACEHSVNYTRRVVT